MNNQRRPTPYRVFTNDLERRRAILLHDDCPVLIAAATALAAGPVTAHAWGWLQHSPHGGTE